MNKTELIRKIASTTDFKKAEVTTMYETMEKVIMETLAAGEDVSLTGFLNFEVSEVEEATKRNPRTGEAVVVPAHRKVSVKARKALKECVNSEE